jgi:hypothetical protein
LVAVVAEGVGISKFLALWRLVGRAQAVASCSTLCTMPLIWEQQKPTLSLLVVLRAVLERALAALMAAQEEAAPSAARPCQPLLPMVAVGAMVAKLWPWLMAAAVVQGC